MKKVMVPKYITDDGCEFNSEEDALLHERMVAFKAWYDDINLDDNWLYADARHKVEANDVLAWLIEFQEEISKLYNQMTMIKVSKRMKK